MNVSFGGLEAILERIPPHSEHLIAALQEVQAKFNYIPAAALEAVCDHVGVPRSHGWAVATFYKVFSLEPKGEHEINVCMGTACHVRGTDKVYDKLKHNLDRPGPDGAALDQEFSLNKVYCLGCCSMGPVAKVDEEIHGNLDQRKAGSLIKTCSKG
jgi:NADH-quinone oxidoreductase subunit E